MARGWQRFPRRFEKEGTNMSEAVLFVALIVVLIVGIECFSAWKGR